MIKICEKCGQPIDDGPDWEAIVKVAKDSPDTMCGKIANRLIEREVESFKVLGMLSGVIPMPAGSTVSFKKYGDKLDIEK